MADGAPTADTAGARHDNAGEDIDVANLSEEKIKMLLATDPRFITRLIGQLDANMHTMMDRKRKKLEQIEADQKEIDQLNNQIKSHVQPNIDRLTQQIKDKTVLRDNVASQLGEQKANLVKMERDAAALISSIRGKTSKLMKSSASQRLEELRGFSTNVPTTTLVRGGTSKSKTTTLS